MRSSGFSSVRVLIRRAANYCRPLHCLQNALDAYVKGGEDEILSKPYGDPLMPQGAGAAAGSGVPVGATAPLDPIRARRRKPPRGNSSFLLRAVDSAGGFSGLSNLGFSLGFKVGGGLTTQDCSINYKQTRCMLDASYCAPSALLKPPSLPLSFCFISGDH